MQASFERSFAQIAMESADTMDSNTTTGIFQVIDTSLSPTDTHASATTARIKPARKTQNPVQSEDGENADANRKPRRYRKYGLYSYKLHNIRESILNTTEIDPDRPYSQKELSVIHNLFFQDMGLSNKFVVHTDCGHFYFLKRKGDRLKKLEEKCGDSDANDDDPKCFENVGNCSVCWKGNRTPNELETAAMDFIQLYENYYPDLLRIADMRKSFQGLIIQRVFYIWLYNEQYQTMDYKKKNQRGNRY